MNDINTKYSKNDTDKGIVIANKDLYATEVVDISED